MLLTGIAIALGVALMAGTYILTDTINQSFAGIFQTANRGHDVVVTPTKPLGSKRARRPRRSPKRRSRRCARPPGVARGRGRDLLARRRCFDVARQAAEHGGAPAFVASTVPHALRVLHGRRAAASRPTRGEVAIDEATAERAST